MPSTSWRKRSTEPKSIARETLVDGAPLLDDPLVRRRIARLEVRLSALTTAKHRVLAELEAGKPAGPEASVFKVVGTELLQELEALCMELMGLNALCGTDEVGLLPPTEETVASWTCYHRAASIYAGSNEGGYVGIQTGGLQKGRRIGKKLIFAVWNVTDAQPGKGAVCEPFTGEGDGMTCSIAYNWKEGEEYIAAVRVDDKRLVGTITESKTGKVFTVGKMPFAKGYKNLSHGSLVWVEYFGDAASCAATPLQRATFTPAVSNGLNARVSNITFGQKCFNARGTITKDGSAILFATGGETAK